MIGGIHASDAWNPSRARDLGTGAFLVGGAGSDFKPRDAVTKATHLAQQQSQADDLDQYILYKNFFEIGFF